MQPKQVIISKSFNSGHRKVPLANQGGNCCPGPSVIDQADLDTKTPKLGTKGTLILMNPGGQKCTSTRLVDN